MSKAQSARLSPILRDGVGNPHANVDPRPAAVCDECDCVVREFSMSASGQVACANCETWWKNNPPPDELQCAKCHAVIRGDEHYSISGQCKACMDREYCEAASEGKEADAQPDPRASTYFSLAIAFATLIVGMLWFAAVANWGAR